MGEITERCKAQLADWQRRYHSHPERELERLLLMALEREEIVAIGYRESLMNHRLRSMSIPSEIRDVIRQALVWIWQDEEMHALYLRGAILRIDRPGLTLRARARELAGTLGGWATSMQQHVRWRDAPFARMVAGFIVSAGAVMGAMPREVRRYLKYRPFRDYCDWNIEAEHTARLCYQRMIELAPQQLAGDFTKVRDDEERHERIFEVLARAFDDQDRLVQSASLAAVQKDIGAVDEFFLPRSLRASATRTRHNPVGTGGEVIVQRGLGDSDKLSVFHSALDAARLPELLRARSEELGKPLSELRVVIKPSFMMGYSRRDLSPLVDPELLRGLGRYLRDLRCRTIVVAESSKIYERFFANRSTLQVAEYFDICSDDYRIVDLSTEQVPHLYRRGMAQYSFGRTWKDADFRMSFSKMRSHPIDRVALTISNIEGLGPAWSDFVFADRLATYSTAIMMVLDEFPVDFAILDAYDRAPDGPLGVMGSARPRRPRRIYAARDSLALDVVAARHMGLADPFESPLLRTASYWFGDPQGTTSVEGVDEPIADWHGPCHNDLTALFSLAADFVYQFASSRGAVFVPEMDPQAFPALSRVSLPVRFARRLVQTLFGLRLPR